MSDYLANLAARTLAAPPLRPRVRMRFEPEPAEKAVAAPMIERPSERQARAIEPAAERPPRVVERERVREVAPRQRPVPREERRAVREEKPVVIERVEQRVDTVETTRVVTGPPSVEPAPRPHRYDEEPPHVKVEESDEREREIVLPEPITRERVRERVRDRERMAQRRVPPRDEQPEPAEPTVQVSIGRIEVRAAAPPPAPRRGRPRGVLTIDDYVAKRDGKDRR